MMAYNVRSLQSVCTT